MKKIFTFPGIDLFKIEDYKQLFYWSTSFQKEVHEIEKQISQKGMLQNYIKNPKTDFFIDNLDIALILFTASQVSQAKMLEANIGQPDLILTHSLGEYSAGIYNKAFNYKFAWDVISTLKPYGLALSNPKHYNLLIFGDIKNIQSFCQEHDLHIMSVNSPTCALVWFGDREKLKKEMFEAHQLSHFRFKLLSYPIHTPLIAESSYQSMDDLYFYNIFEKHKNWTPHARYSMVSSTELKVKSPDDMNSLEPIAKVLTTLSRTEMNLNNTYKVLKEHLANEQNFENYVIEYSNNFINYLREIDPTATHKSGLLTATESHIRLFNYNFKVQDLGAYSSMGDSLGFLNKYF